MVLLGLCGTRCVWVRIFEQSVPCGVKVLHHFVISMGTWDGPRTFVSVFVDILICVCYLCAPFWGLRGPMMVYFLLLFCFADCPQATGIGVSAWWGPGWEFVACGRESRFGVCGGVYL